MPSKTEILNLALSHIGSGKEVSNIVTEQSEEARAGRRFYGIARDTTASAAPWPFLTKIAAIGLVEEEPNTEWAYSYRYPSDCIYIRRILSGIRNDNRQTRAPYKIAQDSGGLLLFTDERDAVIEYNVAANNPQFFSADFTMTISLQLAGLMAPRLTGGDPFNLGERAFSLWRLAISEAMARAFNEQQDEEKPESEYIRGRE